MTIHPEYPNKLFAECFQWKIDNEDKPLPAPLQQAFHKEEHRINEWLKEHYQELKTAWASDIERLFEWIRNEWPQRADIRLTKPISFALDIAIASECDRKNGSYTWFADEIEISETMFGPAARQEIAKVAIDIAVQQIVRYLQGDPDDLGDFVFEIYESLDIGDLDDWLTCAYWMTTLYRDEPPLVETEDPYDSIIGREWAKIPLPPDIECLLTAAVDWRPAAPKTEKAQQD